MVSPAAVTIGSDPRVLSVNGKRFQVPPDCCLMEWVGEKSPLEIDEVHLLMATGHLTPDMKAVLKVMSQMAVRRVDGSTTRTFLKGNGWGEIPRLTVRRIQWGPRARALPGTVGSYVQLVRIHDARLIQQTESGHEFVVYGDPEDKPKDPADLLILPNVGIEMVKMEHFRQFKDFRRAMGPMWSPR